MTRPILQKKKKNIYIYIYIYNTKIEAAEIHFLRSATGVTLQDRRKSDDIRKGLQTFHTTEINPGSS
jgi:hypothetical protein